MSGKVSIEQAYEPVEVDLWGEEFKTVDVTRKGAIKAAELWERLDTDADDDQAVQILAELLDVKLARANGKTGKASTVVLRKWKADELSSRSLLAFVERLGDADRPT